MNETSDQILRIINKINNKLSPVKKEKKVIITYDDLKKLTKKLNPCKKTQTA